jgi:hypothetical protein
MFWHAFLPLQAKKAIDKKCPFGVGLLSMAMRHKKSQSNQPGTRDAG